MNTIRSFRRLDDCIATAGQPTEEQFRELAAEGTRTIINLALPTSTYALPDERKVVTELGMEYVSIPVVFEKPTAEDFARFCAEMDARRGQKILVHCAMNYRVSAFMALYRVRRLGWAPRVALVEMRQVWDLDEVWGPFVAEQMG